MDTSPIDLPTFTELQEAMGADFALELVETFCEEAPTILAELRRAVGASDADAYRRAAHSLKSNGQTFGALTLAAMARDAELGGMPAEPAPVLDALDAEYAAAAAALQELARG